MADSGNGFWQQYQDNLRESNRQAPWRFLRLLVAFGLTLILAPCSMAAAQITGKPLAGMAVALVGILFSLGVWQLLAWAFNRPAQSPHYQRGPMPPMSPYRDPFAAAEMASPQAFSGPGPQPLLGSGVGPVPPFAAEPARPGGGGCIIALLAVGGLSLVLCCGGGATLFSILPNKQFRARPNQAGPRPRGFAPVRQPFPVDHAFPGDPLGDMHQRQQQQIDRVLEQHHQMMREQEERMRELQRQIDQQQGSLFDPDF